MFAPYHNFPNSLRLLKCVNDLKDANGVPDDLAGKFYIYHDSLFHKLKCANLYIDELSEYITNSSPHYVLQNAPEFFFEVNRLIDGFFYSGGSALDILAREVLVCFGINLPSNVYYRTAREQLSIHKPGDSILLRLVDPPWKDEFSKYRNALTHEVLIASNLSLDLNLLGGSQLAGGSQSVNMNLSLPDDPRVPPSDRVCTINPNVVDYSSRTFRRLLTLINIIYGEIRDRAVGQGSLPL